jgi:predicted ATPase/class 3 adenylate cyclase/Tfp pilus assembly protein PilF
MTALPSGIVTFLFTDIEGSTRLWEADRAVMLGAARRHDELLGEAVAAHDGVLFKHVGDMVQAAFARAADAVAAAVAAQRALAAEPWTETGPIRARMAIHLGEAAPDSRGDYHQVACLNRLSRLMSTAHGGQILLSRAVKVAIGDGLPSGVTLRDLGRHRLRDLLEPEEVTQLIIAGLPADFPPLKSLEGHATNLPTLPTALIGREMERGEIARLLEEDGARLVTLVGPGGVGKTHLALQTAADLLDDFADGVWLVRLGEVTDPAMIEPAIAVALGVREGGGLDLRAALRAWIGDKRVLFVLDNLEQVITGAPIVADLLAVHPHARFLATSRQRLRVGGERAVAVPPLALPISPADDAATPESALVSAAVQLFATRASEVAPDFVLDDQSAPTVAAICAHLDGLPLAIELAAAQLRTRTLPELLTDLEHRFELLIGGRREALSHQQSLEATIAWSYDRLDPDEQRLLQTLSVFAGGWGREAAEQVASRIEDLATWLGALTEKSLARRSALPDDTSRWTLLESIRAFGRARLEETGESMQVRDRHAAWCLAFAEDATARLEGGEQVRWLDRLDLEHDNARAALRWYGERDEIERTLALATALGPYWQIRGHLSEGRRWLEGALRDAAAHVPTRLPAMVEAGLLAEAQGAFTEAQTWFTQAIELARARGDRGREAALLNNLGAVAIEQGDFTAAEAQFTQSLALSEELGDRQRRALALSNLGALAHYRQDVESALRRYMECLTISLELRDTRGVAGMLLNILLLLAPQPDESARARAAGDECLRLFRTLGDLQGQALALGGLGLVAATASDLEHAADLHRQSLRLAQRIEDRSTEARALGNLGMVELEWGCPERAADLLTRSLRHVSELGELDGVAAGLEGLAAVRAAFGASEHAARLLGAARALRDRIGVPLPPEAARRTAKLDAALTRDLGHRYSGLLAAGSALPLQDAIAEALRGEKPTVAVDSLAASLRALDDVLGVSSGKDSVR